MLTIYNTLSRKKEEFKPINKTVTMYSCGPTVYSFAHIGNMRAYIFMDCVRRVLKYDGYKIKGVMNITDVGHLVSDGDDGEDKLENAARAQNKSPYEIAVEVTEAFMRDLKSLNIGLPEIVAKATDHIDDMLEFVKALMDKGYAYETRDGIYFDIQKFEGYGKLSGQKPEGKNAGARIGVNTEKKHPADFALWKKAPKNHIMQWPSPWGQSFPGWHIECSAMSRKFLGAKFDIHTGGVDHIPVHHENELAQSEALEGDKTVNYWMHGEFMQVDGGKMSKSLGNVYTISQLISRGFSPLAFRYFCLNTHYRKALNFTFDALEGSKTAYKRLLALLAEHKYALDSQNSANNLEKFKSEFCAAINDDINIPLALGVLWTLLKEPFSRNVYDLCLDFDKVLGLDLAAAEKETEPAVTVPDEVKTLLDRRAEARKNKDYKLSDILRDQIAKLGYAVADGAGGQSIKKK